jgi:hypothetical protein|tara:strand:- start:541 stop:756 length:216 start_codon:yes stop_codon:yes gene_type:complete
MEDMKAKEKAIDLVNKFLQIYDGRVPQAKQCALICVDEMLEFAYDVEWEKREEAVSKLKFLKEVKQEINKL